MRSRLAARSVRFGQGRGCKFPKLQPLTFSIRHHEGEFVSVGARQSISRVSGEKVLPQRNTGFGIEGVEAEYVARSVIEMVGKLGDPSTLSYLDREQPVIALHFQLMILYRARRGDGKYRNVHRAKQKQVWAIPSDLGPVKHVHVGSLGIVSGRNARQSRRIFSSSWLIRLISCVNVSLQLNEPTESSVGTDDGHTRAIFVRPRNQEVAIPKYTKMNRFKWELQRNRAHIRAIAMKVRNEWTALHGWLALHFPRWLAPLRFVTQRKMALR